MTAMIAIAARTYGFQTDATLLNNPNATPEFSQYEKLRYPGMISIVLAKI